MSLRKSLRKASFSVVLQSYCIPHRYALTLARNAAERHYVVIVSLQGLEVFHASVASTTQRLPWHDLEDVRRLRRDASCASCNLSQIHMLVSTQPLQTWGVVKAAAYVVRS
jgi:hypothetical protein